MANILTENPWILDGSNIGQILVGTQIKIRHFEYQGYANGLTSIVTLGNRFGQIVWKTTGDTSGGVQRSGAVGWIYGLQILSWTDGIVLVYIE